MIYIVALAGWFFAALRWGDWKNWRRYHASILYVYFCDILYYFLTFNYPLWNLEPKGFVSNRAIAIGLELIIFACSVLIYLGRFPKGKLKPIIWIGFWVVLYTSIEGGLFWLGVFKYFHGWTILKSALFNILAFPMIRLHLSKPILTYLLSVPITIVLLFLNHVPVK
ncbi:hypothetical protein HPT25_22180 [Bacillus sp. BRMEA1]|uniref:CBO0543 family protein n=1 Tax=Neobacillus endophyticus TaxID=2738405 RepID=UPI0015654817|nr:CBO0543 family protein [Neobacillus endophyticus]NRD80049.1 hypothetical protein [Neobacillus endophyticus]